MLVALCILWSIGLFCLGYVDSGILSTRQTRGHDLFWYHHGINCPKFFYVYSTICEYISIYDKHS